MSRYKVNGLETEEALGNQTVSYRPNTHVKEGLTPRQKAVLGLGTFAALAILATSIETPDPYTTKGLEGIPPSHVGFLLDERPTWKIIANGDAPPEVQESLERAYGSN